MGFCKITFEGDERYRKIRLFNVIQDIELHIPKIFLESIEDHEGMLTVEANTDEIDVELINTMARLIIEFWKKQNEVSYYITIKTEGKNYAWDSIVGEIK